MTKQNEKGKPKRRPKRKLVDVPTPSCHGWKLLEVVSSVKCTLNRVLRDPNVKSCLENVVFTINQHRKRLSMLTKELLLAKLHAGEALPELNQSFFSALATAMRNGTWNKSMTSMGHERLLERHQAPINGVNRTLLTQAMALVAKRMEANVRTHYSMHYERFVKRWSKLSEDERGGFEEKKLQKDPEETELHILIQNAWQIRRCLEVAGKKGFALFPEARADMGYVTLDNTCVTQLFKQMYPDSPLLVDAVGFKLSMADLGILQGQEIWNQLFHIDRIQKLRGSSHHFRWSLQTNGYGVVLSFGKWHEYRPKNSTKRRKITKATHVAVQALQPGREYSYHNKTLRSMGDLEGWTVRAVDPGVHRTYTSVDLLTDEKDVRETTRMLRGKSWRARIKSKKFGAQQKRWRDAVLVEEQKALNMVPYCTSSFPDSYALYVDATYLHWDAVWTFVKQRMRRKLRFRAWCIRTRELDREVDRLCAPREGNHGTLLIYGNGARTNLFDKVRSGVRGPAKQLFERAKQRKKAVTIWADEFRTSKLDPYGHELTHPPERRPQRLTPSKCRARAHGVGVPSCRCYCKKKRCPKRRTTKCWCEKHKKSIPQHDVCYCDHKEHGHRMWNRDVCAALNIGCLFLAQALGLHTGPWTRGEKNIQPKSWAEVYVDLFTPFSLPLARHCVHAMV